MTLPIITTRLDKAAYAPGETATLTVRTSWRWWQFDRRRTVTAAEGPVAWALKSDTGTVAKFTATAGAGAVRVTVTDGTGSAVVQIRIPYNVEAVVSTADVTPPTVPATPVATAGVQQITVTTAPSTDIVAVAGYRWYRAGVLVGTTTGTSFTETGLTVGTNYAYTVAAFDTATPPNVSAQSAASNDASPLPPPDTTAPTVPGVPVATAGVNSATVTTSGSTDAVGVVEYEWFRGGLSRGKTDVPSFAESGLASGTAVTYTVRARDEAFNWSNQSAASNSVTPTTGGALLTPPAPTLTASQTSQTSVQLSWTPGADTGRPAVTSWEVERERSYDNGQTWDGWAPVSGSPVAGNVLSFLNDALTIASPEIVREYRVRGINSNGAGAWSNTPDVQWEIIVPPPPPSTVMLTGCSASPNLHGGTEAWDVWRVYKSGEMLQRANQTGALRPKMLAYSKQGENLGGAFPSYTQVFNEVMADLNGFYYTSSTGQTHSSRWGIKLYWSNGNEHMDKGALSHPPYPDSTPHTDEQIGRYRISQSALYDACHYVDPSTGQRRFPDAYAGCNPTMGAEKIGIVEKWLHATADKMDFVMWSMYPPGREQTPDDPTFTKPSFVDANYDTSSGFMLRCFRRTKLAQDAGRTMTGNQNFRLQIACGEIGIGQDPNDSTHRPWYAVHSLAGSMVKLATQYGLTMPFACWWDQSLGAAASQNILTDEPAGTEPSTAEAWAAWSTYNHEFGGTHPASWTGNPKLTGTNPWKGGA